MVRRNFARHPLPQGIACGTTRVVNDREFKQLANKLPKEGLPYHHESKNTAVRSFELLSMLSIRLTVCDRWSISLTRVARRAGPKCSCWFEGVTKSGYGYVPSRW
jgi:hypothetical protein